MTSTLRQIRTALLLMPSLAALQACTATDCTDLRSAQPLAGLFRDGKRVELQDVTLFGIGAPGDSMLLDAAHGVQQLYLPFRIDSTETSFVLDTDASLPPDTITFTYSAEPWFASHDCGAVYHFHISGIDYTTHALDSVTCPGGTITNAAGENIFIYLK